MFYSCLRRLFPAKSSTRDCSRKMVVRQRLSLEHLEDRVLLTAGQYDTLATANVVSLTNYTKVQLFGNIDAGSDVDLYKVSLNAGDTLRADIDARSPDSGNPLPGNLDSILTIFDSVGNRLTYNDDAYDPDTGIYSLDSYLNFQAALSGIYYVGVSSYNNFYYNPNIANSGVGYSTGQYYLQLTKNPDTTPPSIDGAPTSNPNTQGWYNHPVTVHFTAWDYGSGVSSVTPDTTLSNQGANQFVTGYATDRAGNTSSYTVNGINIDLTAPTTTADEHGYHGEWVNHQVNISLSAADQNGLSGVQATYYTIDGGTAQTYNSGTGIVVSSPGVHNVTYWSVDNAGNVETGHTLTVQIDTMPPETSITSAPNSLTNNNNATFNMLGSDTGGSGLVRFEYQLDGSGNWTPTNEVLNLSGLTDGNHTLSVRALDAAGNVDPTPANYTWTVDTTPPDTSIVSHPNMLTNSTSATFTFHGTDALSGVAGFAYQLDGGNWTATTSPLTLTNLADGSHTLLVHAIDAAGNVDPNPASYTWTVDTVPPQIMDVKVHWGTSGVASLSSVAGRDLPWMGINQIEVVFSKDVVVNQNDLALSGLSVPSYGIANFSYNPTTHTAIWTLSSSPGIDHLTLALDGANDIHDQAGNLLSGGPTSQHLNVLPGDVSGDGVVNSSDLVLLRNNFTATTHTYNVLYDLDGDGTVDMTDYVLLRNLVGTHL